MDVVVLSGRESSYPEQPRKGGTRPNKARLGPSVGAIDNEVSVFERGPEPKRASPFPWINCCHARIA